MVREVRIEANCSENNDGTILGSLVPSSVRITSLVSVTETPPNIIANQGVGVLADRPSTELTIGDIYVATDTNLKYTATSTTAWDGGVALIETQFVSSDLQLQKLLYQFNGAAFRLLSIRLYNFTPLTIDWTNVSYSDFSSVFGENWENLGTEAICVIDSSSGAGHPSGVIANYVVRFTSFSSSPTHRIEVLDDNMFCVAENVKFSNRRIFSVGLYGFV